MALLPEFDTIRSLSCRPGMYREERLQGVKICEAISFLKMAAALHGENAKISLSGSSDGYPGYVNIVPEKELQVKARREKLDELEHLENIVLQNQQEIRQFKLERELTTDRRILKGLDRKIARAEGLIADYGGRAAALAEQLN